jgi:hypothetical protein
MVIGRPNAIALAVSELPLDGIDIPPLLIHGDTVKSVGRHPIARIAHAPDRRDERPSLIGLKRERTFDDEHKARGNGPQLLEYLIW